MTRVEKFTKSSFVEGEIFNGYSLDFIKIDNFDLNHNIIGWESLFGLIMLRIISFNHEYKNALDNNFSTDSVCVVEADEHCSDCKTGNFCLECLKFKKINVNEDFAFIDMLIYIFYPPLYLSGPIILYNSFKWQWKNNKISEHNLLIKKDKILYCMRFLIIYFSFEFFNHYIFVNALFTNKYNKSIVYGTKNFTPYEIFIFIVMNVTFIYFKFLIIWRFARIWSWFDGIYTEENLPRCIFNIYSLEHFWRAWHRSYNIWLIRYIYIPLGGVNKKIFNIWVIFLFVALWHDIKGDLIYWALSICIFLIPEKLVKNYCNTSKYNINNIFFRYVKYILSAINIFIIISVNLVGFGIGFENYSILITQIVEKYGVLNFFIVIMSFLIPTAIMQYYIRELENEQGIKNNY